MKTIYLYVPGILTLPGNADNWTGRAVTWTHIHTPHKAEKVEYLSSPLTRPLWNKHRAAKLARTLSFYNPSEWQRVLVGHSNGCDVIIDALQSEGWPPVAALHLIAGACSNDFAKLGLAQAQASGAVEMVTVYTSEKDRALSIAGTFLGKLLGFGTLGKSGPINHNAKCTHIVHNPAFDHSTWFDTEPFSLGGTGRSIFDTTMGSITGANAIAEEDPLIRALKKNDSV